MAAQVNNDLINENLTPMDRSRYYNVLIAAVKLTHDMDKDSTLEELDKRLAELEDLYKKTASQR